jgi:hypothetical protein
VTFRVRVLWSPRHGQWLVTRGFEQLGAFDRIDQAHHFAGSLGDVVIDLETSERVS